MLVASEQVSVRIFGNQSSSGRPREKTGTSSDRRSGSSVIDAEYVYLLNSGEECLRAKRHQVIKKFKRCGPYHLPTGQSFIAECVSNCRVRSRSFDACHEPNALITLRSSARVAPYPPCFSMAFVGRVWRS